MFIYIRTNEQRNANFMLTYFSKQTTLDFVSNMIFEQLKLREWVFVANTCFTKGGCFYVLRVLQITNVFFSNKIKIKPLFTRINIYFTGNIVRIRVQYY